jgi:hypothetical protein
MTLVPYTAVLIIPTGIAAAIGGYAGDGLPVARALATVCDRLITHPNVMNGAQLYWPMANTLYVEGYGLDRFAQGDWGLQPVHHNRVGIIFDAGIEPDLRLRHLQAAEATRATLGLDLTDYVITDAPLNVELRQAPSGASWGTIGNPESLLRAADRLINQAQAQAIAIVARFPDDIEPEALQHYRQGAGVDPLAGAEAVISHLIVREFKIPAAHAPALAPLPLDPTLSPKSAAEELGYTFFPCVLVGLSRAPRFIDTPDSRLADSIWAPQVNALIVPANAFGGSASLSLSQQAELILAIEDNLTAMRSRPEPLGIKAIRVNSYLEAIGLIAAHRAGMSPFALSAHLSSLRCLAPACD